MNLKPLHTIIPTTITLANKNGMELKLSTFGATILSLKVPNKHQKLTNVVLSLQDDQEYYNPSFLNERVYLGSTVGRYAGRISNTGFTIDQQNYTLPHDHNNIHLHGGMNGFDRKIWKIQEVIEQRSYISSVVFSYKSKHLEEGFPGNLMVKATYSLTDNNEVIIQYTAVSDQKTHVNMTNHSYYNLSGKHSILNHKLQLNSDQYLEVNKHLIPTGKIVDVAKTKYDYRTPKIIGDDTFTGLDDTFVFNTAKHNAVISSEETGITMKINTNQPGVVIYTPVNFNHLNLKKDTTYTDYPAICFETQKFPDSPNNTNFPTTLLEPNKEYNNTTILSFSF